MKKISVIALVCALAMMLTVPFGAFADASFAFNAKEVSGKVGDEVTVAVEFAMGEGVYLLNGDFVINYPADKLDLVVPPKTGVADPVNKLCTLTGVYVAVNADEDKGEIKISFADDSAEVLANMTEKVLAKLPFVIKDGAEGKIEVAINTTTLMRTEDGITGIDALAEEGEITATAVINVEKEAVTTTTTKATTTKATTTTTKATTAATTKATTKATAAATTAATTAAPTTAATTKAPTAAGEATPWALLATVTVAGAALVVLSTKKSK